MESILHNLQSHRTEVQTIDQLLNYDLSKFKLYKPTSLFPIEKEDIVRAFLKRCCPICNRKLYQTRNKAMWICKSKVKDGFVVQDKVISKFTIPN